MGVGASPQLCRLIFADPVCPSDFLSKSRLHKTRLAGGERSPVRTAATGKTQGIFLSFYGHWTKEDDAHSARLYKACGVVRIARTQLELSAEETNPTERNFALQWKVRYTIYDGSIKPHIRKTKFVQIYQL